MRLSGVQGDTGAVFAPLAMGGAGGPRTGGPPADRLARWLEGMETAGLTAMRPLISAAMAEAVTNSSRVAVQRNLAWMEARGLVR